MESSKINYLPSPPDLPNGVIERGQKLFKKKCAGCHSVDQGGPHKSGPNLWGLIGRQAGMTSGYNYSDGMKSSGILWNQHHVFAYLENFTGYIPGSRQKFVPGTRISFPGLEKAQDRADIIAYLKTATQG